jgi:hypothetical protein
MRILWVGKAPDGGAAGDEIFDRKILSALRAEGVNPIRVAPERVSKSREILNLLGCVPYYRARYASRRNDDLLRQAAQGCDIALCSWEPFDALAYRLPCPVIPILHNVTSQSLPSMFPRNKAAALAAFRAGLWEKHIYPSSRFPAIAVLSCQDGAYVKGMAPEKPLLFTPPGMPPLVPLAETASFKPEILISGTYDWLPRHRDIIAFAEEYGRSAIRLPVIANGLPAMAAEILQPEPLLAEISGDAIRLGLIPDRFEAGHKLKTTYYIANNAIVLTFANVIFDFADIEDHAFFIRKISRVDEIEGHIREISRVPPEDLRQRLTAFKQRCADRFSWTLAARTLLREVEKITGTCH